MNKMQVIGREKGWWAYKAYRMNHLNLFNVQLEFIINKIDQNACFYCFTFD